MRRNFKTDLGPILGLGRNLTEATKMQPEKISPSLQRFLLAPVGKFGARMAIVLVLVLVCQQVSTPMASGQGAPPTSRPGNPAAIKPKAAGPRKPTTKTTIIEFELLQEAGGGALFSQNWLKVLEPLDVSLRVHRPVGDDNEKRGTHAMSPSLACWIDQEISSYRIGHLP